MMRKLLLFFAMLSVSIGAWAGAAEGFEMREGDIGVWFVNNDPTPPEKVIKIEVTKEGGLKAALDELTAILTGEGEQKPHYANFRNKLDEAAQGGSDFLANNRLIVKVVFTGEGSLSLSNDDISALNSLNIPTIDLQDLNPASAFTLSNSNVKNLILPDQWTMAQVQAAAQGCSSLNAALSIGTDVGAGTKIVDNQEVPVVLNVGSLVAYVNTPGTLYQSTRRLGYLLTDPNNNQNNLANNTKLGNVNPYTFALTGLKLVTIKGTPSARDFNGSADTEAVKFDADGHFVFDKEADETKTDKDAAVGGGFRKLTGTTMTGALSGSNLTKLDLGDAIITDDHYSDLTISWSYSCVSTSLKEIIFPTTDKLTKLPADCLNGDYSLLEELCIPGNIKVLKTRACFISTNVMRHVWTTGTKDNMVYDNGAYLVVYPDVIDEETGTIVPDEVDHYGHAPLDDEVWNAGNDASTSPRYGTITLPEGLTLIESHNFTARSVSDVYVLAQHAPECHVDAFSTIMYTGNNTVATQYIQQMGMVTRKAYAQDLPKGEYIAFLHYPRQSGTPDIQRYTDPTREYSVATTMRDGKGNIIYFPNQSEFNRAYIQGMTGYLWYAWDSERVPEGSGGNANSFANVNPAADQNGHTTAVQELANGYYESNTMTDPKKTDRSFYDVRLDGDGQPSLAKPADLEWYYDQYRTSGGVNHQLYPAMETTQSSQIIGQVQSIDENGKPVFHDCPGEGDYVKDFNWVEDPKGGFVLVRTHAGYEGTTTPVEGVSTYYSDNQGKNPVTPKVQNGYFFEDGTKPVYESTTAPVSGVTMYYDDTNGTSENEHPTLDTNNGQIQYYYNLQETEQPEYAIVYSYDNTVAHWYSKNGNEYSIVEPPFSESRTIYYYDSSTERYVATNHFVDGVTQYYQIDWKGDYIDAGSINMTGYPYYRQTGNSTTVKSATPTTTWQGNVKYYVYEWRQVNGQSVQDYYEVTTPITFSPAVYYANGQTVPNYSSADEHDYNASTTYYTSNTGETVVNPVNFNTTYYYETFNDDYQTYNGQEGTRYNKEEYYRLVASGTGDYCPTLDNVYGVLKGTQNDYRGWHQFVLTAYATNDKRPFTPVKFYQTDNDWWTVCLPYDLKYNDMIKFFGNEDTGAIPYLSKLRYVVRDYDKEKITLMFSKNLMEYKEVITNPSPTDDYVHGVIDDKAKYTEAEKAANPIILHKGVPYLIKPNIDVNAGRSFDVFKTDNDDLYERLIDAENVPGGALESYIYKGEYTVPAYVIGENAPEATVDSKNFPHVMGPTFSYSSSDKITYGGQEVSARVSNEFSYTFVGSFFLSILPQNCYFLGWDSKKNCAAFWYNKVTKLDEYAWNNQTGVICANFDTDTKIDPATDITDPAKWYIPAVASDDLKKSSSSSGSAKAYGMDWGGAVDVVVSGIGKINVDNAQNSVVNNDVIYDMRGVRMNRPLSRLPKGVYIVNGKKYVVD